MDIKQSSKGPILDLCKLTVMKKATKFKEYTNLANSDHGSN